MRFSATFCQPVCAGDSILGMYHIEKTQQPEVGVPVVTRFF